MLRCFASQHRSFFSCLYLYVSAPTHSHTQMITTTQPTSHALTHCFATSPPSPFPMSRTYNHIPCSVFLPHYPSRTHILASLSSPPHTHSPFPPSPSPLSNMCRRSRTCGPSAWSPLPSVESVRATAPIALLWSTSRRRTNHRYTRWETILSYCNR